jgi:hypothetical protein
MPPIWAPSSATWDYIAAAASYQQALEQFRDLGDCPARRYACAQTELGLLRQLTGTTQRPPPAISSAGSATSDRLAEAKR